MMFDCHPVQPLSGHFGSPAPVQPLSAYPTAPTVVRPLWPLGLLSIHSGHFGCYPVTPATLAHYPAIPAFVLMFSSVVFGVSFTFFIAFSIFVPSFPSLWALSDQSLVVCPIHVSRISSNHRCFIQALSLSSPSMPVWFGHHSALRSFVFLAMSDRSYVDRNALSSLEDTACDGWVSLSFALPLLTHRS